MENYVITISRQFASMGRSIAQGLAQKLEIEFYDRDIVEATAKRMGQPVSVISDEEENSKTPFLHRKYPLGVGVPSLKNEIFEVQSNIIRDLAEKESCIIVGRCANSVLRDHKRCLNVYIYAPYDARLDNCINELQMKPKVAPKMIDEIDKARDNYRKRYCEGYDTPFDGYDIMLDSSRFGIEETIEILYDLITKKFHH